MHGAGNDFIVIDNRFFYFSDAELADLARTYCPRRFGIGADGLLALAPPQDAQHHYRMRYFNADGSVGTMCANGARCLARFARNGGIEADTLAFESDAGIYRACLTSDPEGPVQLFVPPPAHYQEDASLAEPGSFIWTGTEHAVVFVPEVAAVDVATRGAALRQDPALGEAGANVNFVEVVTEDPARLRVRTFEKGVEAETWACGTGAIAAAVVAYRQRRVADTTVAIAMRGGDLTVRFAAEEATISNISLEGPATTLFRGTLEV